MKYKNTVPLLALWLFFLGVEAFSSPSLVVAKRRHVRVLESKLDDNLQEERVGADLSSSPVQEEEEEEESASLEEIDPIPPLPTLDASVIIPYILFISFWPALALLRLQLDSLPMPLLDYFDVDKFMALQGMMQDPPPLEDIVELPALSPAEQMVGAIFGPPTNGGTNFFAP